MNRLRRGAEREKAASQVRHLAGLLINAQEAERSRVARELHDGLSQNLALQAVELELLGQAPPATPAELTQHLRELSARTKKLSTEVHQISHDLHPAKLTQLGLTAAISELCHVGASAHRIPIAFHHNAVPRSLPEGVALCLYRIAQESIRNVVKHSGATSATVELRMVEKGIQLSVADDGKGFVFDAEGPTQGLGLVSMRERARLLQGEIRIESQPGHGARVEVWVPLERLEAEG